MGAHNVDVARREAIDRAFEAIFETKTSTAYRDAYQRWFSELTGMPDEWWRDLDHLDWAQWRVAALRMRREWRHKHQRRPDRAKRGRLMYDLRLSCNRRGQVVFRVRFLRTSEARIRMPGSPMVPRRVNSPSGRPRAQATRSSAKSGDSPSDEDGESPSPRLTLDTRRALYAFGCERCAHCGHTLVFTQGRLVCPNRHCRRWGS